MEAGSIPHGVEDADGRCWESPLGQTAIYTSRLQVEDTVKSAQSHLEGKGQAVYEGHSVGSPFFNADRREPPLADLPAREERQCGDSPQQASSAHAPQRAQNKRSPPSSPSCVMHSAAGRDLHAHTYWALDDSCVQLGTHTENQSMPGNNATVTQSHEFSPKNSCWEDRRRVFTAPGDRRDGSTVENIEASFYPSANTRCLRTPGPQELSAGRMACQPATPSPLQHPHSPGSPDGTCRTVSISTSGALERALGSPPSAAWQAAPSCERSPKWSVCACRTSPPFPCDGVKGFSKEKRVPCAFRPSTTQWAAHYPHAVAAANKTANMKASGGGEPSDRGLHHANFPAVVSHLDTRRLRVQGSSQFLLPVAAEPSPSVSIYSGSSRSEACLACEDLSNFQGGMTSPTEEADSQLQGQGVQKRKDGDTAVQHSAPLGRPCSHVKCSEQQPSATAGVCIEPQPSRVMELRRLKRVMRALYSSVSGTYRRSEDKQQLDHYDATPGKAHTKRLYRRHARNKLQKTEKIQRDIVEPGRRHRIGLRRRLRRRLLPQNCHATATSCAGGIPKPAGKRRYYRRVRLYRRGREAISSTRFSFREGAVRSNRSDCKAYAESTSDARVPLSISGAGGTSKRLIRLPISFSDRVRRGTLVIARSMQSRARRSGTI